MPNKSNIVEEDVGLPLSPDPVQHGRTSGVSASSSGTKFLGNYQNSERAGTPGGERDRRSVRRSCGLPELTAQWGDTAAAIAEETEKLKREYEYKIATMQQRHAQLERDLDDARAEAQSRANDGKRARDLEDEVRGHRKVRGCLR